LLQKIISSEKLIFETEKTYLLKGVEVLTTFTWVSSSTLSKVSLAAFAFFWFSPYFYLSPNFHTEHAVLQRRSVFQQQVKKESRTYEVGWHHMEHW